jgi:predicted outer membrane repeat protein
MKWFVIGLLILQVSASASARTWHVEPDGTGDVPSIKAAVDSAAAEGDTVLLANGTFAGAATITDCVFTDNTATDMWGYSHGGGGVLCRGATEITNCTFAGNTAYEGPGGAIYFQADAGALYLTVSRCTFLGNSVHIGPFCGAGLAATGDVGSSITITDCTFAENPRGDALCGATISIEGDFDALIENTIVSFAAKGGAVHLNGAATASFRCCDIFGNTGGDWAGPIASQNGASGNFSLDPLFCGLNGGNVSLQLCSPCLPGLHPSGDECGVIGALGPGCECGGAAQPATWGMIKALYR